MVEAAYEGSDGHALVIKGIQIDSTGNRYFTFRNSWGEDSRVRLPVSQGCTILNHSLQICSQQRQLSRLHFPVLQEKKKVGFVGYLWPAKRLKPFLSE